MTDPETETTNAPELEPAATPEPAPEEAPAPAEPDDPAGTPEPPPEQTEPAALSEKVLEARFKSLEKEGSRHANRISEIMGEDAQELVPCPLCTGPFTGFIFPPDMAPIAEPVRAAVKEVLGETLPEYEVAEDKSTCEKCAGLGRTLTGSQVPDQIALSCAHCKGYGWTYHGAPQANGSTPAVPVAAAEDRAPLADDRPSGADPWGRVPGDALYGVLPQYAGLR